MLALARPDTGGFDRLPKPVIDAGLTTAGIGVTGEAPADIGSQANTVALRAASSSSQRSSVADRNTSASMNGSLRRCIDFNCCLEAVEHGTLPVMV